MHYDIFAFHKRNNKYEEIISAHLINSEYLMTYNCPKKTVFNFLLYCLSN